jgi:penicillin-binding protein 2B
MIFNTVMKNSLQYMQIDPTEEQDSTDNSKAVEEGIKLPSLVGMKPTEAEHQLEELGLEPIILGSGQEIIAQYPEVDTPIIVNEKVLLQASENVKMPNIAEWSKRDVMKLGNLVGLSVKSEGSGYVTKQSIKKDSVLKKGDVLSVTLKTTEVKKQTEEVEED